MEEVIFPNGPIDIGTPWKHKWAYPEDITFFYLNPNLIFKVCEDEEIKFKFTGFTSINKDIAEYSITTKLPRYYCRQVNLNE